MYMLYTYVLIGFIMIIIYDKKYIHIKTNINIGHFKILHKLADKK